ncbi:MAG: hypothetical protein KAH01_00220 [Caldisericia bacterium]|nr:hypothetical protein [Caldisericia bacterium]
MKKFSVLLVILLLATPLLAYGLTTDYDEGGIPLQTIFYTNKASDTVENQEYSFILAEEPGEPGSEEEAPPMTDPFFPEPDGFKGTITEIDADGEFIKVSNVYYINHYTGQIEFAEFYTFYPNQYTDFVINGDSAQDIHSLLVGEYIISIGEPNYEQNKLTDLAVVYQGSIYPEEVVITMPFSGQVKSIDRENGTIEIFCFETAGTIIVEIHEETSFQHIKVNSEGIAEYVTYETEGIPSEVVADTICDFVGLVNNRNSNAIVDNVIIVAVNNG